MNISHSVPLKFSCEVKEALESGKPVVALESNVITHGLDYPDNVITAKHVEQAVRESGAVPATIGIDNGEFLIGMSDEYIEKFATASHVPKVTSRDIPVVLASGGMGATTVASSILAAEIAGIKFFCSAGIGGVHRGAETSMDISADLTQLTRSRVAVVCAGAKNILDIGLTLEFLETWNVPIISYQSDDFPAFYCRSSGFKSPQRLDDPAVIAKAIEINWMLPGGKGILITTPTKPEDAIESQKIDMIIQDAVLEAKKNNIVGNSLTKYLMRMIDRETNGISAKANMAVLVNTANVAGKLAVAHAIHQFSGEIYSGRSQAQ
ncbi:pseudouridine-5'-phosphate glycosidase [Photorhabdus khanii]|uniref:Pseudouridine-5'-phosphate glycosidase n=1 Tax=Photorhabdus khanii subsp. guanajuatensis TaxID=2100166 RepID=A0A4R4JMR8_9GAMM|nr:pseudouridine-5'-phosphate glycosidase [Photorhabdus khanii]TDB54631.1 pseudouridine-5-phosphate glycosidase [Photorhabdus khanii subsp. guanajuatensis]